MLLEAAMVSDEELKEPQHTCTHYAHPKNPTFHGDNGTYEAHAKRRNLYARCSPPPRTSTPSLLTPRFYTPTSNLLGSSSDLHEIITNHHGDHHIHHRDHDIRLLNSMAYSPVTSLSPYYFSPVSTCSSIVTTNTTAMAMSHDIVSSPPMRSFSERNQHANITPNEQSVTHTNMGVIISASMTSIGGTHEKIPIPSDPDDDEHMPSFSNPDLGAPQRDGIGANISHSHARQGESRIGMEDFIRRGGPALMRSFSATDSPLGSRCSGIGAFARVPSLSTHDSSSVTRNSPKKSWYGKPSSVDKKLYHSAQLRNEGASANVSPLRRPDQFSLDELFPLKPPNRTRMKPSDSLVPNNIAPMAVPNVDASLNTRSTIPSTTNVDNVLKDGAMDPYQTMVSDKDLLERPPHEVVLEANDVDAFVYSPVASAFVFSPRRSAQVSHKNLYLNRISSKVHNLHHDVHSPTSTQPPLKSILKKTPTDDDHSTQLDNFVPHISSSTESSNTDTDYQKDHSQSVPNVSTPKISSVLLRLIEAEEQLLNVREHDGTPSCLPTCSFLGRALRCGSKLEHHQRLQNGM